MLMPISEGDVGGAPHRQGRRGDEVLVHRPDGAVAGEDSPADVVVPLVLVVVTDRGLLATSAKMPLTPSTRSEATLVILPVSRATATVTGPADACGDVHAHPGSRFVKVFVDEVIVCAAAVPGQRVTCASLAP